MALAIEIGAGPWADEGRGLISEALIGDLSPCIAPGDPVWDLGGGAKSCPAETPPYDIFLLGGDIALAL